MFLLLYAFIFYVFMIFAVTTASGSFLLFIRFRTLLSGFFCLQRLLVPPAFSGSGFFLRLIRFRTLLSGFFCLQWLSCTLGFFCLWVLPAPYTLLHPLLWVFLSSIAGLYPRLFLPLGLSCSLRLPVPLHDDSSLCIYRYCDCPVVLGAKP